MLYSPCQPGSISKMCGSPMYPISLSHVLTVLVLLLCFLIHTCLLLFQCLTPLDTYLVSSLLNTVSRSWANLPVPSTIASIDFQYCRHSLIFSLDYVGLFSGKIITCFIRLRSSLAFFGTSIFNCWAIAHVYIFPSV